MSIKVESATEVKETVAPAPVAEVKESKEESASTESKTKSVEASEDETVEASDTSEEIEAKSESDDESDVERTKKPNVQKRIDKLTKKAADERREKEFWRTEALKAQSQKTESKPESVKPSPQVNAEGVPQPDDFENHSDYVRAVAKWEVRQEMATEKQQSRENSLKDEIHQKRLSFAEQAKKVAEAESDYDDVMDGIEGVMIPPAVQSVLLESDDGAKLAYELAKDPKEFERICSLAPLAAARAIGKIEARLSKDSDEKTETKEIKTTKAPKPLTPLGSKSSGSVKKSIHDPDLSQKEYEKLRMEQMGR